MSTIQGLDSMAMLEHEYRVMFQIEEDYWWYRGVRVMLAGLLGRYLPHNRTPQLLDAGCGTGKNLELLQPYGDAWGVDLSRQAIEFCHARGLPPDRLMQASVLDLPFPDGRFDLSISFDVVCNIADDVGALREIGRVLAPGARLILLLPAFRFLWSAHDVAVGHQYRYTARDLRDKIARAGLVPERVTYVNLLLFPAIAAFRFARRGEMANGASVHSDLVPLPRPINGILTALFQAEMRAALQLNLPYGVSTLAIARKER